MFRQRTPSPGTGTYSRKFERIAAPGTQSVQGKAGFFEHIVHMRTMDYSESIERANLRFQMHLPPFRVSQSKEMQGSISSFIRSKKSWSEEGKTVTNQQEKEEYRAHVEEKRQLVSGNPSTQLTDPVMLMPEMSKLGLENSLINSGRMEDKRGDAWVCVEPDDETPPEPDFCDTLTVKARNEADEVKREDSGGQTTTETKHGCPRQCDDGPMESDENWKVGITDKTNKDCYEDHVERLDEEQTQKDQEQLCGCKTSIPPYPGELGSSGALCRCSQTSEMAGCCNLDPLDCHACRISQTRCRVCFSQSRRSRPVRPQKEQKVRSAVMHLLPRSHNPWTTTQTTTTPSKILLSPYHPNYGKHGQPSLLAKGFNSHKNRYDQ
uniref:uncharacterized protein n=1 Tax=Myxine glutinosa TaxID=7769 RepID=UPI00358F6957